ncbi:hypothetical protein NGM10_13220 [Halorussus salilacus]|uniref:hypothetical protein n=1 Tax=Halorussus salilacus TaxID=2953750 RepID=UPI00209D9E67|nr:hypothetical protein [Halorussus salilacus]USZ67682.1 hypothetical protein NGM10_13220 [Halorussus salilacus]
MSEPSIQNENKSAIGSPADAGEATAGRRKLAALARTYREHALTQPIQIVGFWSAVALPFLYLPLLVTGISSEAELLTFVGLLALNLAALLAGHGHKRE